MSNAIQIRSFQLSDLPQIMHLFHDTVHSVNSRDYTPEQIAAWTTHAFNEDFWAKRLSSKITWVAEAESQILGFTDFEPNGHIDCFYCHHQHQGRGIGSQLLNQIEQMARSLGIRRLFAEVSITAKPFFLQKGFTTVQEQQVTYEGMVFCNFVMEKFLED